MPAPKHLIDGDLCADLLLNLELIQAGGIPSPERAGELRRRLNDAIVESMRGFTRRDPAQDDLYKTVPPPPTEAA